MKLSLEGASRSLRSLLSFSPRPLFAVGILLILSGTQLLAQTGTFVDRWEPTDLRVVSYNIYQDSIFPDDPQYGLTQPPKFARVMQALQPDIINLQEIYDHQLVSSDPEILGAVELINSILPLPGGASWHGHQAFDNIILSKYPLTMKRTNTFPAAPSTSTAIALVDLPDDQFATDFYLMNNHFKCCGGVGSDEDIRRQQQADALVNWMRDVRTPGGIADLPADTPMAVVGDLNIVGSQQPLNTVIDGNIINELAYGSDSPPDWDGTDLADAHPVHNGTGTTDYTWRSGCCSTSRIDFVLYTDSVADVANKFVLNTVTMSAADRTATGLQSLDIAINSNFYDHLPLVVDFRLPLSDISILGDYDGSDYVDEDDFLLWRSLFGTSVAAGTSADGNGNSIVDAADYSIWRDNLGAGTPPEGAGSGSAVPEPGAAALWLLGGSIAACWHRRATRWIDRRAA